MIYFVWIINFLSLCIAVKKFPRKSKDNDFSKSSNGPGSMVAARSSHKEGSSKLVIKREKNSSSLREHKRSQLSSMTPSAPKNNDGKLSDGDFDYEAEFEQFKFSIASPDLSLYHSVLDSAMPKLFSGESLENIHEKSSIPTPEHLDNIEKSMNDKNVKETPTTSNISISKQPSPLVMTRAVGPHQSRVGSNNNNAILPDASSILMDSKPESGGGTVIPAIQLVQSGEEKTGRELSSIMQENSKLAKKRGLGNEGINWESMLAKKIRLEEALSNINARQAQVKANLIRLSGAGYDNCVAPVTSSTIPHSPSLSHPSYVHSTPLNSLVSNQESQNPGQSLYGTHETPHGTPAPSPLPSPCLLNVGGGTPMMNQAQSYPTSPHPLSLSQPATPINNSLPTSPTYSNQPTPTSHYSNSAHPYYPHSSQGGPIFFNSQVSVPLYQPRPLIPALVHVPPQVYTHSSTPKSSQLSSPTIPHPSASFTAFTFPNSSHGTGPSPPKVRFCIHKIIDSKKTSRQNIKQLFILSSQNSIK